MKETSPTSIKDKQNRLLQDIVQASESVPDVPVKDIIKSRHMIAVTSNRTGLCTRIVFNENLMGEEFSYSGRSARELSSLLLNPVQEIPETVSYAMATINSILPVPDRVFPFKAQDLMLKHGKGKNAVVIGHFPFVEKLRPEFRNMWVLEIHPRPGDLPAKAAGDVLPKADVVAMTATTLLNGTCAELLGLISKETYTIMLGPSTPFAPCLFDWGIDVLAGCSVLDATQASSCIREGLPFKKLRGTTPLVWTRD